VRRAAGARHGRARVGLDGRAQDRDRAALADDALRERARTFAAQLDPAKGLQRAIDVSSDSARRRDRACVDARAREVCSHEHRHEASLRYFPFPGRAGAIRDALRIGGIAFEDATSARSVRALKASGELPFGSLPVLDVETAGGRVSAAQSNAILRFVGRRAGLYPTDDDVRALKVDEALDLGEDLYHLLTPSMVEENAERRMAMRKVWPRRRCRAGPGTSSGSSSRTAAPGSSPATR
jgi:hypothetical protein